MVARPVEVRLEVQIEVHGINRNLRGLDEREGVGGFPGRGLHSQGQIHLQRGGFRRALRRRWGDLLPLATRVHPCPSRALDHLGWRGRLLAESDALLGRHRLPRGSRRIERRRFVVTGRRVGSVRRSVEGARNAEAVGRGPATATLGGRRRRRAESRGARGGPGRHRRVGRGLGGLRFGPGRV